MMKTMRTLFLLAVGCALALLPACGNEGPAASWTETEQRPFSLIEAAGMQELMEEPQQETQWKESADPAYDYGTEIILDEENSLCVKRDTGGMEEYSLVVVSSDGEETALDVPFDAYTTVQGKAGSVAVGRYQETILPYGITFARWEEAARSLNIVYQFEEGVALGFQQFFSPDGSKAAFSWTPKVPADSGQWKLRVVDMTSGEYQDLTPPDWEGEAEFAALYCCWLDNDTLQVTESDGLDGTANSIVWECRLP